MDWIGYMGHTSVAEQLADV